MKKTVFASMMLAAQTKLMDSVSQMLRVLKGYNTLKHVYKNIPARYEALPHSDFKQSDLSFPCISCQITPCWLKVSQLNS